MFTTLAILLLSTAQAAPELPPAPEFWLQRSAVHYGNFDTAVLDGLLAVEPQLVQVGLFGAGYLAGRGAAHKRDQPEFWASYGGGEIDRTTLRSFIKRAHAKGVLVQGMFSIALTYGNFESSDGIVHAIDRAWDENQLGPRPSVSALDLLQRDVNGKPLVGGRCDEGNTIYWGCPANPHWRAVLKALVKSGIELGIDGFTLLFPHRQACSCSHCQQGLRKFLAEKYTAHEIEKTFGIENIEDHTFPVINGFYKPDEATPLALECLKFGQRMLFECEREVFLEYGRRLKPDLIVGQWNHIYCTDCKPWHETFAQLSGDERCTIPTELWALRENFVWLSIGNSGGYWRPRNGQFGQFTLEHKYLREVGRGLPHTIKVDDSRRLRTYLAEAVSHGGFGPARGPKYRDPVTQEVLKRYFRFLRRHESLYRPIESYSEVGLVFPRRAVHRGELEPVAAFKSAGKALSRDNVLYDVILDENIDGSRLRRYKVVLLPTEAPLDADESQALRQWQTSGGRLQMLARASTAVPFSLVRPRDQPFSRIEAPPTLSWTVWSQPDLDRLLIHMVNYDRDLEAAKGKSGPAAETRRPATNLAVRLRVPAGVQVHHVSALSPDGETTDPRQLPFQQRGRWLELKVESVEVYTIVVVDGSPPAR